MIDTGLICCGIKVCYVSWNGWNIQNAFECLWDFTDNLLFDELTAVGKAYRIAWRSVCGNGREGCLQVKIYVEFRSNDLVLKYLPVVIFGVIRVGPRPYHSRTLPEPRPFELLTRDHSLHAPGVWHSSTWQLHHNPGNISIWLNGFAARTSKAGSQ